MATILVVDDDVDVLETLTAIVRSGGHRVVKAPSPETALDVLDGDTPFDLMITDVLMPGIDGFALAALARARRHDLRILFMTAFYEQVAARRDPGGGLGKLVQKPLSPLNLRQEVEEALAARPS